MPEVIDLISSSPPKAKDTENRLSADFSFLSDDFDDTIDLDEPTGKRRLSPQHDTRPLKRPSPALPRAIDLTDSQPTRFESPVDLDPFDSPVVPESSLFVDSPKPPSPSADNAGDASKGRSPDPFSSLAIPESQPQSDPFGSSPWTRPANSRPAPANPRPRVPLSQPESDPFLSSPIRQTSTRPAKPMNPISRVSLSQPESDPFASSPTGQASSRPAKSTNPISRVSLSQPESDPFASSPMIQASSRPKPTNTSRAPLSQLDSDPFASSPILARQPARQLSLERPKATSHRTKANWDPISSSAPESSRPVESSRPIVIDIESDSDEFPDIADFDVAKQRVLHRSQSEVPKKPKPQGARRGAKVAKVVKDAANDVDKEAIRREKQQAREADKEAKRREKQEAKEAKAREKQRAAALAEVNKVRTDKKVSTPEMLVDIPASLDMTTKTQLEAYLEGLDVQFTSWDSPVDKVIKWRRKVKSEYNDDVDLWEPVPLRIEDEKHVLVVMTADEFVKLALEDGLEAHVAKMTRHFDHQIIYLLEGLTPWMRKNRNSRNRQFASRVRSEAPQRTPQDYVSEETVEDALLQLQVMHNVLIHHTTIPMETAHWISAFTQHLSTVPYRLQKDQATLGAGFCMESGQVKTGEGPKDTYVHMLQEIVRVTGPIAYGIVNEFATVGELVRALEAEGPKRLESVRKGANKDGAFSDRTIGQAVSRRIHKVFTGRDEGSTDV